MTVLRADSEIFWTAFIYDHKHRAPETPRLIAACDGFLRRDFTPKPAYEALLALVRGEWWLAPTTVRTDADGRFVLDGYLGRYTVTAWGRRGELDLRADRPAESVRVDEAHPFDLVGRIVSV